MSESLDEVVVHLNSKDFGDDARIGRLRRTRRRSASVMSFTFEPSWLSRGEPIVLDPALGRYQGDQYAPDGGLLGIFTDTAPDRWGRTLLQRREAAIARREDRRPRVLDDWDFLLGVSDELRMGALRLADSAERRFLSDDVIAVPPIARLRQLEALATRAERGDQVQLHEEEEELALLIAPGSSLGGTRPKANFRNQDGLLWIAKFPSRNDTWDVGLWEHIVAELARLAGLWLPRTGVLKLLGEYRTFTAERFDRAHGGRRLYASAMTLVGKRDNDAASYLDIADAIARYGSAATIGQDLEQLFRRVVFNVLTANRDDHLRNHGFVGIPGGWRLSPAFDINPAPTKRDHAIALNELDHTPDLTIVRETARYYRLRAADADAIISEVTEAVKLWRQKSSGAGATRDEIDQMAQAFAI